MKFSIPTTDKIIFGDKTDKTTDKIISENKKLPKTQCVKIDSLRKDYDLEKWMKEENNMYAGRRGRIFIGSNKIGDKRIFHYSDSKWRNPYKVPEYTLEESLKLYEEYVRENLMDDLHELEGKILGCFCDQKNPCHTQILVKLFKEKYNI